MQEKRAEMTVVRDRLPFSVMGTTERKHQPEHRMGPSFPLYPHNKGQLLKWILNH